MKQSFASTSLSWLYSSLWLLLLLAPRSCAFCPRLKSTIAIRTCQFHNIHRDDYDEYIPSKRGAPQGGDMAYIATNIQQQMNTYQAIRQASSSSSSSSLDSIHDVYVCSKSSSPTTFWYIGKIAMAGVTLEDAMNRQWNLLEEHSTRLRPVELGRSFGSLEYWVAPADSEELCRQGTVDLIPITIMRSKDTSAVPRKAVGFLCEVVMNNGIGFCLERQEDGTTPTPFQ